MARWWPNPSCLYWLRVCSVKQIPPMPIKTICMPCSLQLLPSIFTIINLYQVPLAHTQLMGLSNTGSCVGPVWGAVPPA
eukprot:2792-Pelagomonas_calceolata.AAC.1